MQYYSSSPIEMFSSVWRNRSLIGIFIKREVLSRYRGSFIGILWLILNPLFMLTIYTFVFSVVFKARWGGGSESKVEFALVLFAGLIVFNFFSDCFNRAPGLIVSNQNFVKKVVFPLEILPWIGFGSAIFNAVISFVVWFFAYLVFLGVPHVTIFYLPIVFLPFCMVVMGLSWLLASLGVYLRDVGHFTSIFTTVLMFLSPIFYPASSLPESFRSLIYINPLTAVIEQTRDVVYWGRHPDFLALGIFFVTGLVVAWLGFAWFQKTRKGFADVL